MWGELIAGTLILYFVSCCILRTIELNWRLVREQLQLLRLCDYTTQAVNVGFRLNETQQRIEELNRYAELPLLMRAIFHVPV